MRFSTLNEWLEWQQTLHWQEIELGLGRISQVAAELSLGRIAPNIITVAGTNGKGSTVAYYSSFLQAEGLKVGCYTSPHLLKYNERIAINGVPVSDDSIMSAFDQIDQARNDISLSYFEFGTLAALICMKQADVEVAILEVGLGGRLDAVNIIDADLIHFTPIGIDHTAWLGETRELIAFEKAGVLRPNCQVICNDPNPPQSLLNEISKQTSHVLYAGKDFQYNEHEDSISINDYSIDLSTLNLTGRHQKLNCSAVIAGMTLLKNGDFFNPDQIKQSISNIKIKGRFQLYKHIEKLNVYIDVGHNADAAVAITDSLLQQKTNKVVMILGMLDDKSVEDFTNSLSKAVDHCVCLGLDLNRGLSAIELSERIDHELMSVELSNDTCDAWNKAKKFLKNDITYDSVSSESAQDIIIVTGSFYTVEAFLNLPNFNS